MNAPVRRHQLFARLAQKGAYIFFVRDVTGGCFAIAHNILALLGVVVTITIALIASQPDLRHLIEMQLAAWLTQRQSVVAPPPPPVETEQTAADRATAADPQALSREQAQLTLWIAHKYQVAPEPVAALVAGAYHAGGANRINPVLILAVMAVESGFNPFAQNASGAQGLMQVMTHVHLDKYDDYGGQFAAFDPISNLRVGVWVLHDCIDKTGSTEGGLRCYVGTTDLKTDGGYVNKVMAEYARLQQVVAQASKKGHPQIAKIGDKLQNTSPMIVASAKTGDEQAVPRSYHAPASRPAGIPADPATGSRRAV